MVFTVNITFNPRHLDLSSVIINTDLGFINDNSPRSIVNAILKTNSNFFWILSSHFTTNFNIENDLNVRIITPTSAVITSNNNNFFGLINVCFQINLSSVITNTNLGIIDDNNLTNIINAILIANPNSRLRYDNIIIRNITPISAIITSNNADLIGHVEVNLVV